MEIVPTSADTGFVVALLNRADEKHPSVTSVYVKQSRKILLPQTVLAEVAYLVGQSAEFSC